MIPIRPSLPPIKRHVLWRIQFRLTWDGVTPRPITGETLSAKLTTGDAFDSSTVVSLTVTQITTGFYQAAMTGTTSGAIADAIGKLYLHVSLVGASTGSDTEMQIEGWVEVTG